MDQDGKRRQPWLWTLIILLATLAVYLLLSQPVEDAYRLQVVENTVYLTTRSDGFRIVDISDPLHPQEIGFYNTPGRALGFSLVEKKAYIAAGGEGVIILDLSDPAQPEELGRIEAGGRVEDVAVQGQFAYVASGRQGLQIFNIQNPKHPTRVARPENGWRPTRVVYHDERLYLAERNGVFRIIDVSMPRNPVEVGSFACKDPVRDILVKEKRAYLACGEQGLILLDLSDPKDPKDLTVYDTPGEAEAVFIHDGYAYIADGPEGVRVVDLSFPDDLRAVGDYDTPGYASSLAVVEGLIYVADGLEGLDVIEGRVMLEAKARGATGALANVEDLDFGEGYLYLAAGSDGLQALDLSDPEFPVNRNRLAIPGSAVSVDVAGDLAYIAARTGGLRIVNITDPAEELEEISSFSQPGWDVYDVQVAESPAAASLAYLAAGSAGLRIIDITTPGEPVEVGSLPVPDSALGLALHGDYLYLAAGSSGLQVIQVSDPRRPILTGTFDTLGEAHAVAVETRRMEAENTDRTYAYVADGPGGLRVIDVTDPYHPQEIGAAQENPAYARDVRLSGEIVLVAAGLDGLRTYSVEDPATPQLLGTYDSPGQAIGLALDGQKVFLADYDWGVRVVDFSDPRAPVPVGFYDSPLAITDLALREDLAYAVDGRQGLWVLDVSNPDQPREAGFVFLPGGGSRLVLQGEHALVAGQAEGLQIVDLSNPKSPVRLGSVAIPDQAQDVAARENLAYVSAGTAGLQIVDFSDPRKPVVVGGQDTPGEAQGVALAGDYAYLAAGTGGLQIIKVKDPRAPKRTSVFDKARDIRDVAVAESYAYLAGGEDGLLVLDISRPLLPEEVYRLDTPGAASGVTLLNGYAFVADGGGGLTLVDISNPKHPVSVGEGSLPGSALTLAASALRPEKEKVDENENPGIFRLYVATGEAGLQVVDAGKSLQPELVAAYDLPGPVSFARLRREFRALVNDGWQWDALSQKTRSTIFQGLLEVLFTGLVAGLFWMFFFSRFTLPVFNLGDQFASMCCLFAYMRGRHGPLGQVREGKLLTAPVAAHSQGPGVFTVDLSSAIALDRYEGHSSFPYKLFFFLPHLVSAGGRYLVNAVMQRLYPRPEPAPVQTCRVRGPGLVFTRFSDFPRWLRHGEKVRTAVDLRPQVRLKLNVSAHTRDGVELESHIFALFTVGADPEVVKVTFDGEHRPENLRVIYLEEREMPVMGGSHLTRRAQVIRELVDELDDDDKHFIFQYIQAQLAGPPPPELVRPTRKKAPFIYDDKRVFAAVYSQAQEAETENFIPWAELPAQVITKLFRDRLLQFTYDELYFRTDPTPETFRLRELKKRFIKQIRNLGVLSFQYVERKDGEPVEPGQEWDLEWAPEEQKRFRLFPVQELTNPKVLRARGIRILSAGFSDLKPAHPEVRAQLVDYWAARWQKEAIQSTAEFDLEAERVRNAARIQAQREMIHTLEKLFREKPMTQEALALRLLQALESAAADPLTRQLLPSQVGEMLRNVQHFLLPGYETHMTVSSGKDAFDVPVSKTP